MIIDKSLLLAPDLSSFATEVGTSNVGDIIDAGDVVDGMNINEPMWWVIQITTAADGGIGTNGTLQFQLVSDGTTTIATDGSQTIHVKTDAFTAAQLPVGTQLAFPLPRGPIYERYIGIQLVQAVEGEDDCAGVSFISLSDPEYIVYPNATS